jgi:universal stress protein A
MNSIQRILAVCSDVNECEDLARDAALLARVLGAELHVLTVLYDPFGTMGLSFPRPSLQEDYRKLIEKTRQGLQVITDREKNQGVQVRTVIREGKPLREISAEVRERNIDLMVLAAHKQTWLESLFAGGNNKKMLRRMPCSILYLKREPKAVAFEEDEEKQEDEEKAA